MSFDLKEVHRYCTIYTVGTFFMFLSNLY